MRTLHAIGACGAVAALSLTSGAFAQADSIDHAKADAEFAKFRAEMEASNPAELNEMKGEGLWNAKRGPKNASLAETCDLGLGIGKVEGAYVASPRYYPDADKVMDMERRIVWCMVEKQGFKFEDIARKPFQGPNDANAPEITDLVTFVAGQSRNMKFAVPMKEPKVKEAWAIGKEIASFRAGPFDFSCNTCHGTDGKRIRMQNLPNLARPEGAIRGVLGWPGYRMTGGVMLTSQWRMNDCFRQQRFPEPKYVSDTITYLLTYMTGTANGQLYKGPGIKR
ncbi:MAG: sulfur oxidation c-type cytochrome SoxA [Sulfuritalea sp.]|nr:sulfur oxidation c-type cytochrome SoxA [Sulfuritalea sp.]